MKILIVFCVQGNITSLICHEGPLTSMAHCRYDNCQQLLA